MNLALIKKENNIIMLLTKKQFWIMQILIWLYLIIALAAYIYIWFFNENLSTLSKIFITTLSLGLYGNGHCFESYNKYRNNFLKLFYPKANSKEGFIIFQLFFKGNLNPNLYHLISFLKLMKSFVNMNGLYFSFSGPNDINLNRPKYFDPKALEKNLSNFKDKFPQKLFIFDVNRLNISFNSFNYENTEKYTELCIEINLDTNIIFGLEDCLNKIMLILCSELDYVYGRIILKHDRKLINQFHYVENTQFYKLDPELNKCISAKLKEHIPDIYWANIINSIHASKIKQEDLSIIKDNVFKLHELPNNGYYIQLTKYINDIEKEYIQEKIKKIKIILNNIISPELQKIVSYKFDYIEIFNHFN